jgi:hypothetical protein
VYVVSQNYILFYFIFQTEKAMGSKEQLRKEGNKQKSYLMSAFAG